MRVFQDNDENLLLLQKLQEYQKETGDVIHTPKARYKPLGCPKEAILLRGIQNNLLPPHIDLIRQYLPLDVVKTAQMTHMRAEHRKLEKKVFFLENAVRQIGEHDPFFLTMDDIHEVDMMLTQFLSKMAYYHENIYLFS